MNKYKEALNKIRNIVLDESGDGYYTQRYLQDFYSNACGTLQELVDKADSLEWIPVTERMPEEHDSIFAKLYGTDKWTSALWRTTSNRVIATIKYNDGTVIVKEAFTHDGEWTVEKRNTNCKVIAWMPFPKPYNKEQENDAREMFEKLGWLEEETCTNESEYNLVDGFECSNCGIIIENYNEIEIDEDYPEDRCMKEYTPRYCPNCGRKIVD